MLAAAGAAGRAACRAGPRSLGCRSRAGCPVPPFLRVGLSGRLTRRTRAGWFYSFRSAASDSFCVFGSRLQPCSVLSF